MCTVLLPLGVNPTAVNKYIDINFVLIDYHACSQILIRRPGTTDSSLGIYSALPGK